MEKEKAIKNRLRKLRVEKQKILDNMEFAVDMEHLEDLELDVDSLNSRIFELKWVLDIK